MEVIHFLSTGASRALHHTQIITKTHYYQLHDLIRIIKINLDSEKRHLGSHMGICKGRIAGIHFTDQH